MMTSYSKIRLQVSVLRTSGPLVPMYKPMFPKTDLAIKLVKVIQGPSFEQTTMGWSPRYYIPGFVKIGPSVLKKICEHGGHVEI